MSGKIYKAAIIALLVAILALLGGIFYNTRTIECGSCGAIVHNWWQVSNIHTGELVDVCERCYSATLED